MTVSQDPPFNGNGSEHPISNSNGAINGHPDEHLNGHPNGHQNVHQNGYQNGPQNGQRNGYSNGLPKQNGYHNGSQNGHSHGVSHDTLHHPQGMATQTPIAVVGIALRLPGHCNSPKDLWDFMSRSGVASTDEAAAARFSLAGHFDGSRKPLTMKTPGAMVLEDVDPADFDAAFFNINMVDAGSMDPQQRLLMEVVYECLENGGVPLEKLAGQRVGCLVGACQVDYHDMTSRDPEDRTESPTMGDSRAMLGNRISHFLGVHGPSMAIDTACSSTLVAVDMACLYLQANQCDAMIVGGVNMYLSPERNQDMGAMRPTASPTGQCHAFDASADGYVASEAINAVFLKRLDDAVRDGDPIRAVIRGTATNSSGRTPGIAMPSAYAQALAIRAAYANAGISADEFNDTGFLECHGTGTLVGDPIEVEGAASVFAASRRVDQPLIIGSIKSNVGHSESGAGLSGLIKAVLAIEKGAIPGTSTFINPNPKIDFEASRVRASRTTVPWPAYAKKRASVNSFGFGGANAHAVLEDPEYLLGERAPRYKSSYVDQRSLGSNFFDDEEDDFSPPSAATKPKVILLSANNENSLKAATKSLATHLLSPAVSVDLQDVAYTLSERRSRLYHRGFCITANTRITPDSFELGKRTGEDVRIGFIFTGQGAQWPQMGKQLLEAQPLALDVVKRLDRVLRALPEPPTWSLVRELTEPRDADAYAEPELSQPLVTALQLAQLAVLYDWGIRPARVVGHSSGEIAAAVAAGHLTPDEAIKVAYFRGQACKALPPVQAVGMLAVGVGSEAIQPYLHQQDDEDEGAVQIACYNSPRSLTLAGTVSALERVRDHLQADGHFARMLRVKHAYHSKHMSAIGKKYLHMLHDHCLGLPSGSRDGNVTMFSSVTEGIVEGQLDATYWLQNMVSPVRFEQAAGALLGDHRGTNFLVELGPSDALRGPVSQISDAVLSGGKPIYTSAAKRGSEALKALYGVAGRLFVAGGNVDFTRVNEYGATGERPAVLVDLPNYKWDHSTKHWHESAASKDWRFRPFPRHDLLGSKVLGVPWRATPTWQNDLKVSDLPWLRDHRIGEQVVFPGAGYVAMAMEAAYQVAWTTEWSVKGKVPDKYQYRLRDVKFFRALVLEDGPGARGSKIMTSLAAVPGSNKTPWYEFKVSSLVNDAWTDHASGLVRIETDFLESRAHEDAIAPLRSPVAARRWYKAMSESGFHFGPSFQKHIQMEYTNGQRTSRSTVSLKAPESAWQQSPYVMHPACIDGCFQTVLASVWAGDSSAVDAPLVPLQIDSLTIPWRVEQPRNGVGVANAKYVGIGRTDVPKNYAASTAVYHPVDGSLLIEMKGLRYTELDRSADGDDALGHTYTHVQWQPDPTLLSEASFRQIVACLAADAIASDNTQQRPIPVSTTVAQRLTDMVAHKKPGLRVLEVDLSQPQEPNSASSLWLESGHSAARAACAKHYFASADARAVVAVQSAHLDAPNSEFAATDFTTAEIAGLEEGGFDYALVRLSSAQQQLDEVRLVQALRHVRKSLADDGLAVVVRGFGKEASPDLQTATLAAGFTRAWVTSHVALAQVPAELNAASEDEKQTVFRLQLTARDSDICAQAEAALVKLDRWNVVTVADPSQLPARSSVLVLDELDTAIMTQLDNRQWEVLQQLVRLQCNLVWVTAGAQMEVSAPEKAAIQGFLRVIRNEEPQLKLISLDVESATGGATAGAIDAALRLLTQPAPQGQANGIAVGEDNELVERRGVIHVARVLPDATVNRAAREEAVGRAAELVDLHSASNMIRLRAERIGSIDSLHFVEASSEPLPLGSNRVEVEVMAAGVNFKEVAVTVGIVPENENLLGYEAAGVVVRVSPDVTAFKPGQRVVVFERGAHANRMIATTGRVRHIPDSMTFEEAASVPLIYMTSLWSLYRIARVRKGSRVLIHSAAGGVGLSAIQLCQHAGAEVFATVGTQDKKEFLISQLNIPEDHIFSSRSRAFGDQILAATDGKGVDVVLNSLTGDLLDESWRIIAYGGTMVEIGKKDILDKNSLAMEPFRRNVTFASLDLSAHEITDEEFADLMAEVFGLIEGGHVKPVWPRKIFSFADIPSAFRLLRTGTHIGKIVLSDGPYPRIKVPVRPAPRTMRLRADSSYLIIGGLRGLCSSLAIHLAKNGARHIAVLSRSGHDDPQSQKVVRDLHSLGAQVDLLRGDVCNLEDVRAAFAATSAPIAGIVQGAMVLRDRVFESMSVEEYHQALGCKIPGTLNLHRVSLELGLNLDFFTLLSSISGLTGSKGQANYAAGNAFMDSFAAYRRGLGLAATSVDLGVIQDVGYMAERDELQQRYDATVWHAINERLLRKIFGHAVILDQKDQNNSGRGRAHVITGIRVPLPEGSSLLRDPRFSALQLRGLQQAGGSGSGGQASDRAKDIQAIMLMLRSKTEPGAVLDAVVDVINRYLMTSLRLSEPLDAARPLSIYGIDSLAAVEFRNWLRADLGVDLSTLEIMNSPSLRSICEKVISKISPA